MKTILVFKTSVETHGNVNHLAPFLNRLINKNGRWNFDLEDCDSILRVETQSADPRAISNLLSSRGFSCEELV